MKSVAQKILISLGFITLIALSVIPVSVGAQADSTGGAPETISDASVTAPTAAQVAGAVVDFGFAAITPWLTPLFYVIMSLVAAFLGLSGLLLDYIVQISVVELTENITGILTINSTWKVIRDLANMSFIFILLYQGIRMVLGLGDGKNSIQNVIKNIIVAAILVNFSLFFTKVIIDASNIVTLGFYKSIVSSGTGEVIPGYQTNFGLTGAFMKALRLSSLYSLPDGSVLFGGIKTVVVLSANIIFMLIATFVFLAVAVMFIIRYISFILLLIMSPIAFVAMAIPGLNDLKEKYVKTLTSQALFAPVFMLLTWVMLTLAGDSGFLKSSITTTLGDTVANPNKDTISLIFEYILIIGLLIQTLVLSKSIATKGGMVTSKYIDKGTAFLGGTMFGGAAALGRSQIGSRAAAIADNKALQEEADKGKWGARLKLGAAKYVAKSSFDARRSTIGEDASSRLGLDLGSGVPFNPKAGANGYVGTKADKKKEFEGKLDEITKRYKDKDDWTKLAGVFDTKNQSEKEYIYKNLSARERVGLDNALGVTAVANGLTFTQHQDTITQLKSKLSKEEKEKTEDETVKYYQKDKKWTELATYLRSKITDTDKIYLYDKLSARDRVAFDEILADPTLTNTLRSGLSIEEKEKTTKAEKELSKTKKEQERIDEIHKIATEPTYAATLTPAQIDNTVKKLPPSQARKLTDESRRNPLVVQRLTVRHLTDLMKDGDLTSDQIRDMRMHATPTQLTWMNEATRVAEWTP